MRLFAGLPVPNEFRKELTRVARAVPVPKARWTAPENLHITLYFLGEVGEAKLPELIRTLDRVPVRELRLDVRTLATFPNGGVLFGQVEPSPLLAELQAEVAAALAPFAMRPDPNSPPHGEYHPHVTLARARDRIRFDIENHRVLRETLRFNPESLNLYRSRPGPGGSQYEVIYSRALIASADAQERPGAAAAS